MAFACEGLCYTCGNGVHSVLFLFKHTGKSHVFRALFAPVFFPLGVQYTILHYHSAASICM